MKPTTLILRARLAALVLRRGARRRLRRRKAGGARRLGKGLRREARFPQRRAPAQDRPAAGADACRGALPAGTGAAADRRLSVGREGVPAGARVQVFARGSVPVARTRTAAAERRRRGAEGGQRAQGNEARRPGRAGRAEDRDRQRIPRAAPAQGRCAPPSPTRWPRSRAIHPRASARRGSSAPTATPSGAMKVVDAVLADSPGLPEALQLKAEIHLASPGDRRRARRAARGRQGRTVERQRALHDRLAARGRTEVRRRARPSSAR